MAIQVKRPAAGNAANTGMPKQPRPSAPDLIGHIRAPSPAGYGQNDGASNPSSVDPGKQVMSPLAANLKASTDDGEGVLDTIIKGGVHTDLSWQTREIGDKNVATHPSMKPANSGGAPSGTVPQKLGQAAFVPPKPGK